MPGIWLDDDTYQQTAGQIWAQQAHSQLQAGEDWAQQAMRAAIQPIQDSLSKLQSMVPSVPQVAAAPQVAPAPPPTPAPEPTPAPMPQAPAAPPLGVGQTQVSEPTPTPAAPVTPEAAPAPAPLPETPTVQAPTSPTDMASAGANWAQQQIQNLLNPAQAQPQSTATPATTPSTTPGLEPSAALPGATSGAPAGPQSTTPGDLIDQTRQAAAKAGIDPDIFSRQINQESGFNPGAQSGAGAQGIAQFMPDTARGLGIDPMDPGQALPAAANLMKSYLGKYGGDWSRALAAYNAGPGNVDKYGDVPPFAETQSYVKNILGGAQDLVQKGQTAVNTAVQGVQSAVARVSQFGMGLSSGDAMAFCGPAAALAFAQTYGRNPTVDEAKQLAQQVGWDPSQGMAGPQSEVKLLGAMGIDAHMTSGVDWQQVGQDASSGNPVIIDTPGHYYYIDGYNAKSGQFHVGTSGTDLKGGAEWMSADQINAMPQSQGGARAAIFADHPLSGPGQAAAVGPLTMGANQPTSSQTQKQADAVGNAVLDVGGQSPLAQFGAGSQMVTSTPVLGGVQDLLSGLTQPSATQGPLDLAHSLLSNALGLAQPATNLLAKAPGAAQDLLNQAQVNLSPYAADISGAPQSLADMLRQNALVSQGVPAVQGALSNAASILSNPNNALTADDQQFLATHPEIASYLNLGPGRQTTSATDPYAISALGVNPLGGLQTGIGNIGQGIANRDVLGTLGGLGETGLTLMSALPGESALAAPATRSLVDQLAGSQMMRDLVSSEAGTLDLSRLVGGAPEDTTRMFHGTGAGFPSVDPEMLDTTRGRFGTAYYLTENPEAASAHATSVIGDPGWTPNVRAVNVPSDLKIFDMDASGAAAEAQAAQVREGLSPVEQAHFDLISGGKTDPQSVWTAVRAASMTNDPNGAAELLAQAGFDGVKDISTHIDPVLRPDTGERLPYSTVGIFPESLDKITNAISGRQGGQASIAFARALGGGAAGGFGTYQATDPNDPNRLLKTAAGAAGGALAAGPGLDLAIQVPGTIVRASGGAPGPISVRDWANGVYRGGVISGLNTMADVAGNAWLTPAASMITGTVRDLAALSPSRAAGRWLGAASGMTQWTDNFLSGLSDALSRPGSLSSRAGPGLATLAELPGALHAGFANATSGLIQSMERGAAAGEAASGTNFGNWINDFQQHLSNPTPGVAAAAQAAGQRAGLQAPLGTMSEAMARFVRGLGPVGDALFPVVNMGMRIGSRMAEFSPVGLAGTALDVGKAAVGQGPYAAGFGGNAAVGPLSERLTNNVMGTLVSAWLASKAAAGDITGSGPEDPKQRAVWLADGIQPNSFRGPDGKFYPWDRLPAQISGPMMFAGAYGDALIAQKAAEAKQGAAAPGAYNVEDPRYAAAQQLITEVTRQLLSRSPARALAGLYDTFQSGGTAGQAAMSGITNTVSGVAGGAIPLSGLVRSVAQMTDPTQRQTLYPTQPQQLPQAILQNIQENLPGVRQDLPARQDILGRPISNPMEGLSTLSPFHAAAGQASPILQAMQDAGVAPQAAPPTVAFGPTHEITLTPDERRQWEVYRGGFLQQLAGPLVNSASYQQMPAKAQQLALSRIDSNAAAAADRLMVRDLAPTAQQRWAATGRLAPVVGYGPNVTSNQTALAQQQALMQALLGGQNAQDATRVASLIANA